VHFRLLSKPAWNFNSSFYPRRPTRMISSGRREPLPSMSSVKTHEAVSNSPSQKRYRKIANPRLMRRRAHSGASLNFSSRWPSEVAREDYINIASKLIGVDAQAALRDFKKVPPPRPTFKTDSNPIPEPTLASRDPLLTQATWELLWLVLHHPEHSKRLSEIIDYEWINTKSTTGSLLSRLLAEIREGHHRKRKANRDHHRQRR
jgi:hypothetical protein